MHRDAPDDTPTWHPSSIAVKTEESMPQSPYRSDEGILPDPTINGEIIVGLSKGYIFNRSETLRTKYSNAVVN